MRAALRARGSWTAWVVAACLVCAHAAGGRPAAAPAAAQQAEATEADLVRASQGRTVRVGSPARGRDTTAIPIELYVAQVLAGEGEPGAADAATQALAVAIRTFAVFNTGRHQKEGFDLCDTTHCQVLRGTTPATRRAALASAGLVLTYGGVPAEVFYSASCGGRSERASDVWPTARLPYLQSVEDDVHQDDVPWTLDRTLDELRDALVRAGSRGRRLEGVVIDGRTQSGRVANVSLPGLTPETMTGDQFRLAVGPSDVRSTAFTLSRDGDRIRFEGRGYGHGIGLCVIGAGRRAARGESVEAILARYYPGLALGRLTGSPFVFESVRARDVPAVVPAAVAPPVANSPVAASRSAVTVRVPPGSTPGAADLERLVERAYDRLSRRLGTSVAPISVDLHATLDSFRRATAKPWWASAAASDSRIDLAPAPLLEQREGMEQTVSIAVAEVLTAASLADRPAWVRVGAARFFGRGETSQGDTRVRCPADSELLTAVSAAAQREAEARAEACFARGLAQAPDWRGVR